MIYLHQSVGPYPKGAAATRSAQKPSSLHRVKCVIHLMMHTTMTASQECRRPAIVLLWTTSNVCSRGSNMTCLIFHGTLGLDAPAVIDMNTHIPVQKVQIPFHTSKHRLQPWFFIPHLVLYNAAMYIFPSKSSVSIYAAAPVQRLRPGLK